MRHCEVVSAVAISLQNTRLLRFTRNDNLLCLFLYLKSFTDLYRYLDVAGSVIEYTKYEDPYDERNIRCL